MLDREPGPHSPVPILIGGSPRSGTTLLLALLERHPEVAGIDESWILELLVQWLEREVFGPHPESPWNVHIHKRFTRREIYESLGSGVNDLFSRVARDKKKKYWVEKTPRNTVYFPEMMELLPSLRFLHVIRDGRDVAASMPRLQEAPRDLLECARIWRRFTRCGLAAARESPERVLEVRYEELVRTPEAALRRVTGFLGLAFDPRMADLESAKVSFFVENWGAGAPPESPVGRWRKVPGFPVEGFKKVAGDLLVELGYEKDHGW